MNNNAATPKDLIIADILVSIVIFVVMMLVTMNTGWDISVIKQVKATPFEVREVVTGKLGSKPGSPNNKLVYMIFTVEEEKLPERIKVEAKAIYHTSNVKKLKQVVKDGKEINVNVFLNNATGEVVGATKKTVTKMSFYYANSFLFKFGFWALILMNVFFIGLSVFIMKKKRDY